MHRQDEKKKKLLKNHKAKIKELELQLNSKDVKVSDNESSRCKNDIKGSANRKDLFDKLHQPAIKVNNEHRNDMKGNSTEHLTSLKNQDEPFSFNENYPQVYMKTNTSYATNNK